ncbi:MAG: hypothetical protein JNL12_05905 [Planctomycetes bacterium]|nr:hypothetical protein [Planctomycetota bacterium]
MRQNSLPILLLVLLPLVWLWPSVFGGRTFVPYDVAVFPPAGLALGLEQIEGMQRDANRDITETPVWFLPELRLARRELADGRLPLWNPHARTGTTIHGYAQLGLCYPPNWLALLANDPADRLALLAWLSLALAGVFAFGMLRELGVSRLSSCVGGVVFQASGPLVAHAYVWMHLSSAIWAPALLWALLRLLRSDMMRPLPVVAVAITFAMPWLAGFPPYAVTHSVIGVMAAGWVALARWREGRLRSLVGRVVLAFACGAMLTAPQLLPAFCFFPESAREQHPTVDSMALQRFDPYALLGFVMPDALGHPSAVAELPYEQSPVALWLCDRTLADGRGALPSFNFTEYSVYIGRLALLLAGIGALAGRGRHRGLALLVLATFVGVALFLPGVRLLLHLPALQNVPPMRWMVHTPVLLAWLAALGLERLLAPDRRARTAALLAASVALVAAVAVRWFGSWLVGWHELEPLGLPQAIAARVGGGVTTQAAVDFVQAGAPPGLDRFAVAVARVDRAAGEAMVWLLLHAAALVGLAVAHWRGRGRHVALVALLGLGAVEALANGGPLMRGQRCEHATDTAVHTFLRERAAALAPAGGFTIVRANPFQTLPSQLPPGQLLEPGIRDLNYYTLYGRRSADALQRVFGASSGDGYKLMTLPDDERLRHPLLDLLGVRYVLATTPLQHAGVRVGPELRGPGGEFFVYERASSLPRAFAVGRLEVLPDDAAVVEALAAPGWEPRRQVFVAARDAEPLRSTAAGEPAEASAVRSVRFVVDHPTHVEIEVDAGIQPWLVVTDSLLPGWSATVDDRPVPIVRGNHDLRVVELPTTACRVVFRYTAPGLGLGLALAAFAAGVLVILGVVRRR